jgi:hypothetical protein
MEIGNFQHLSGKNNGYLLYDSSYLTLNTGTTIPFKIFQGNDFLEYLRIWLDLNRDGDFSDSGEKIYEGTFPFVDSLIDTLNIPFSNNPGITRMRISLQWGGYPTLCTQYQNGETEDYCVLLLPGTAVQNMEPENQKIICYPNPTEGSFNLKNLPDDLIFIKIYDSSGRLIREIKDIPKKEEMSLEIPEKLGAGFYFLQICGHHFYNIIKLQRN